MYEALILPVLQLKFKRIAYNLFSLAILPIVVIFLFIRKFLSFVGNVLLDMSDKLEQIDHELGRKLDNFFNAHIK
jgi:hypothetical protein